MTSTLNYNSCITLRYIMCEIDLFVSWLFKTIFCVLQHLGLWTKLVLYCTCLIINSVIMFKKTACSSPRGGCAQLPWRGHFLKCPKNDFMKQPVSNDYRSTRH